jgi:hypothetical protein
MQRVIRIGGMVLCIVLAIGVAVLSLRADGTMYVVLLIIASLLGVMAGVFKNMGNRP